MPRSRYVVQIVPDVPFEEEVVPVPDGVEEVKRPNDQQSPPQLQKTVEPPVVVQSRILRDRVAPEQQPDDFSIREQRIQRLFQESSLQSAQEDPVIARPKIPRRVQEKVPQSPEEVFRQHLQLQDKTQKIEEFYQAQKPVQAQTRADKKSFFSSLKWNRPVLRFTLFLLIAGGVGVSVWLTATAVVHAQIRQTEQDVQKLLVNVEQGQWQSARERVELLEGRYTTARATYNTARPVARVFLGKDKSTHIDQLFEISEAGLSVAQTGLDTQETFEKGFQQFMGQQEGSSLETLQAVTGQSEALYTELSQLQARVDQLENPFQLELVDDLQSTLNESVPKMRRYFAALQKLGGALPELLGENEKKQYLVLLQNNMELRPTGGFIGSFGILTVQNGKFLDFRVEDVYEADGQLNGYVTPPPEIVQYLGEARWFLRDVNWNPDFPITAQQALWFLDKEIGVKADGVIAVNLHVAQKLLEVTGPINLVDYDEVITKDNLYERAQTHSEMNFFPGSTQKRDFLSALANQLFDRLMKDQTPKLGLGEALLSAADESQILIALNNPSAAQVFNNLGWDGSLKTPQCPPPFHTQECFVDTVMQVEANVGVNKANQYIKRQIEHETILENGLAHHVRTMTLQNTAKSNAWPEGVYRAYIRLFVPKEAVLEAITLDGAVIPTESIKNVEEGGKRVFGFYTEVPIQKSSALAVQYSIPLPQSASFVYALFDQKQSGVTGDALTHVIEGKGYSVLTVAPEPKLLQDQRVTFESDRSTHDFMAVEVRSATR